jgi:hypothetical protein
MIKNYKIIKCTNTEELEYVSFPDIQRIYSYCGRHPLFSAPYFCPDCKNKNNKEGCGKLFVVAVIRGA